MQLQCSSSSHLTNNSRRCTNTERRMKVLHVALLHDVKLKSWLLLPMPSLWSLLVQMPRQVLPSSIVFTSGPVLVVTISQDVLRNLGIAASTSFKVFRRLFLIIRMCMWLLSGVGVSVPGPAIFVFSLRTPLLKTAMADPSFAYLDASMGVTDGGVDSFAGQLLLPLISFLLLHSHAKGGTMAFTASACRVPWYSVVVLPAAMLHCVFTYAIAGMSVPTADLAVGTFGETA